jgi:beta-glucanase (GH16 family)
LVWADEFNGVAGSQPDATKWTYDIGRGNNGWGNNEAQFYTNRPQNVAMDGNGNLVITAIRETFQGASYTSARIKTKNLFEQGYGRFEARLKTPYGQGLWPAFWMLGNNIDQVGWPFCGEIDIMELRGQKPNIASCALHGPGYSGGNAILQEYTLFNGRFDNQYHVFAVEWHADRLDFYIDNLMYRRIEKSEVLQAGQWVYDHPFFLILNVAVGGSFTGPPNASTPFPQKMTIDYVRVYK